MGAGTARGAPYRRNCVYQRHGDFQAFDDVVHGLVAQLIVGLGDVRLRMPHIARTKIAVDRLLAYCTPCLASRPAQVPEQLVQAGAER